MTPDEKQMVQRVAHVLKYSYKHVPDYPLGKYKFNLLRSDAPNARVAPNKSVLYVTTGLVRMFDNGELALIFLHENAHIKYGHVGKHNAVAFASSAVFQIGGAFIPGLALGDSFITPLIANKYSRTQELEADRDAADQAYLLKLTPQAYVVVLSKLAEYSRSRGKKTDSTGLWDAHPDLEARIQALRTTQMHEVEHTK